jgi:hypothetical protein
MTAQNVPIMTGEAFAAPLGCPSYQLLWIETGAVNTTVLLLMILQACVYLSKRKIAEFHPQS